MNQKEILSEYERTGQLDLAALLSAPTGEPDDPITGMFSRINMMFRLQIISHKLILRNALALQLPKKLPFESKLQIPIDALRDILKNAPGIAWFGVLLGMALFTCGVMYGVR